MLEVLKMNIIHVKNLSKTFKVSYRDSSLKVSIKSFFKRKYKFIEAVDNISFDIKKGEIVGYIGPNGGGFSTTIKMLAGILSPDEGEIIINKMTPTKNRVKYTNDIGVVFGQRSQLWWDIPVEDTFDLLKEIYKIPDNEYQKTKNKLINLLELNDIIKIPVRQLSLGQRMRCEIAASLLHKPKILFLDEPTIGLDANSKIVVRNFIQEINKKEIIISELQENLLKEEIYTDYIKVSKINSEIEIINKEIEEYIAKWEEVYKELMLID